jgi:hypothetical protein
MNIKTLASNLLLMLILGIFQIFFLKNLALFGVAFAFLYILPILILPSSIKSTPLMMIAFLSGFVLDIFYETLGMHTSAITLLAFLKPTWLGLINASGGYDDEIEPILSEMGLVKFIGYSSPLIFVYSLVFFTADQWGSGVYFKVFYKSIFSTIFTLTLIILTQLLFFKRRREI